uniref:RRM domain-containing protein n=1 Tax=Macrostomum lignano TaxID=282301 RepID=A0A1I8FK20_9PLAT
RVSLQRQASSSSSRAGKRELKKEEARPAAAAMVRVPPDQNTHVFVQNLREFIEFMSKCGMVLHDPLTRAGRRSSCTRTKMAILTAAARCGYIKKESVVALALQILDGYRLRDCEISVEAGQVKEQQTPPVGLAPARFAPPQQTAALASAPARTPPDAPTGVLVISNVFENPSDIDSDPLLLEKIRDDVYGLRCAKAVVHDRNPDGVVLVTFAESGRVQAGLLSQLDGSDVPRRPGAQKPPSGRRQDPSNQSNHVEADGGAGCQATGHLGERQILGEDCRQIWPPPTKKSQ